MEALLEEGVGVALPVVARDIDMIAYVDPQAASSTMLSVPIKVACFSSDELSGGIEAARAAGLLIVIVWEIGYPEQVRIFALTPAELAVVKMIEIMERADRARFGSAPEPGSTTDEVVWKAIEPYAMSAGKWRGKIAAMLEGQSIRRARTATGQSRHR